MRDDHAAIDLSPLDADDPVGGAQHNESEADDDLPVGIYIRKLHSFLRSRLRCESKENNAGVCDLFTDVAAKKDPGFFAEPVLSGVEGPE